MHSVNCRRNFTDFSGNCLAGELECSILNLSKDLLNNERLLITSREWYDLIIMHRIREIFMALEGFREPRGSFLRSSVGFC